ncbi:hypothetical protein BFJ68_g16916 [Fusarium oxysporum]|uniref:Zn(2)-C6 fungal-type domain-containing protein n=3 Tax=Fusarium oxysporum TaxID=5507 RepID=A0A420P7T8_FUSOX|nr:hypothetical protein BFJ67_g17072 [Fusarium oxysporum f. sp. cepae]RKK24188.1 hypothetical protein BFJ66_g17192 [Fusarium oxysporum f. sp. cepae]RKK88588.1 hypothetical protein BFJ68_g16916 [Fusarium oxysporum]
MTPATSPNKSDSVRLGLHSCHTGTCKSKKTRCDKKTPCSSCARAGKKCTYPPNGPRVRRTKKTMMAEMAGRIAVLERSLAEVAALKGSGAPAKDNCTANDPSNTANHSRLSDDLLLNEGSSSQYFNEVLVAKIIGEDKSIEAALKRSHTKQSTCSPSPFDAMGILSSPCFSQRPSIFHPSKATAMELWNRYLNKVEICIGLKLIHVPTGEVRVYSTINDPNSTSFEDLAFCYSIYFAATISLEESNSLLMLDKNAQLSYYKAGIEQAFAQGDFLNRPTLTVLRALAIYLSAVRIHNRGKSIWILNGLAIRIAQSLGLHREGTQLKPPPFESELRRRVRWHLITRDSRAGEDYGLDDPNIYVSGSEVNLPRNIDDADICPDMEELPPEKNGWTDMTFSLINIDLAKTLEKVKNAMSSRNTLCEDERRSIISEAQSQVQKRLEKCNQVTPFSVLRYTAPISSCKNSTSSQVSNGLRSTMEDSKACP